ncbi:LOW QUALITY PROTEIN: ZZ-type zinc finger-containing protein 3-like [Haliotis rubra]|uniref:LOW QUALITY PROTEIN: ZZ-type zinc finger-containing protein 3-like n=1 Tax=Haliotis rubra TaxID=36100 RepID=UPI001EE54AED|nr:LOW QUALITY PROTEIN: ZZ-type zinc finger-containing protein 3-like [Haliotis rubra]
MDTDIESSNHDNTDVRMEEEDSCYMFESDRAALKGNSDYRELLKTITKLEAQRSQAIKDMEALQEAQEEALKDPIKFVEKLQQGVKFNFPQQQEIAQVPNIDWEKYRSNVDFTSFGVPRHMTRQKKLLTELEDPVLDREKTARGPQSVSLFDDQNEVTVVRGRLKTESKPATFNQLWTVEEQKRLEELLLVFPPEEVEAKRWQKIAVALGNRTTQQVASRVQKYFIKLAKAGLPVPGRAPNIGTGTRKLGRQQRHNRFYYQPSTFMQAYTPPVYMSDDEDTRAYYDAESEARFLQKYEKYGENLSSDESDEDDEVPLELRHSEEYRELLKLRSLRAHKLQQTAVQVHHDGFKCDMCGCEPIIGTRWHCMDCPEDESVDFCDDCVDSNHETETHNSSHRLRPEKKKVSLLGGDQDYMKFSLADSNYLDPNYMPAS